MKRKLTSYKKAFAVSSKRRLFEAHFNSKNLDMFESTKSKIPARRSDVCSNTRWVGRCEIWMRY